MNKSLKRLILLYFIFVIVQLILVSFIPAPSALSDDYTYSKMAMSFHDSQTFSINGVPTHNYPPLYPIFLSFAYFFDNMRNVFFVMKLINVLLLSLVVFPTFLLAREFLSEKKSLLVAVLVLLLPSNFSFAGYLMSENLFYPLFMFSIYFIYKSFTEGKLYRWAFFSGLLIALAFLTKVLGLVLIPIVASLFIVNIFLKRDLFFEFKKVFLIAFVFVLTSLAWILRNGFLFGFNLNGILGITSSTTISGKVINSSGAVLPFFTWLFIHLGYFVIVSGFVFFLLFIFCFKCRFFNQKISIFLFTSLFSFIFVIAFASYYHANADWGYAVIYKSFIPWLTDRLIGRYVDQILPLFIIGGFIGFDFYVKDKNRNLNLFNYSLYVLPFVLLSLQVIFFPLFPVNNMSLAHFGVLKYLLDYILQAGSPSIYVLLVFSFIAFSALFGVVILSFLDKIKLRRIFFFFALLFFTVGMLNYAINYYNSSKYWYSSDQMQMGLWINDNVPKNSLVLFDILDEGMIARTNYTDIYESFPDGSYASTVDFWMNQKVIIGDTGNLRGVDYVVSNHFLSLPLLKRVGRISLYEVSNI